MCSYNKAQDEKLRCNIFDTQRSKCTSRRSLTTYAYKKLCGVVVYCDTNPNDKNLVIKIAHPTLLCIKQST